MSDILSKLQAAHEKRAMVKVAVPEYGFDLYFPPLTLADHHAIRKGVPSGDETELMVRGLIRMARDKHGNPVFENTPAIKAELQRMDFAVLMRIMSESGGTVAPAVAQAIDAIPADDIRAALGPLSDSQPALADVLAEATPADLSAALRSIAAAHEARRPAKNG